jgi:hypothetical protein
MVFERPLCVALDGFTLHGATRAGGLDEPGREALLEYVLRPAVAQERVTRGPDGLVRIALKKAFLGWDRRGPWRTVGSATTKRPFGFDVLACSRCDERMRLLAMLTEPKSVSRDRRSLGEPTDAPARAPARGPPFWKSRVLRRAASDHAAE